jgi:hypothetical protein
MIQTRRYQWNGGIDSLVLANEVDPTAEVVTIQPNYVDVQVDDAVDGVLTTLDEAMRMQGYVQPPVSPPETLTPRQLNSRVVDSTQGLNGEDEFVQISAALGAAIILSVPLANSVPAGKLFVVKDVGGALTGVNTCTLLRQGADTIDGAASLLMDTAFQSRSLVSDGVSRWALISSVL